ncbi:7922_t:CDS:2 [Acaulospora colombiana]|uniref:7922_t:CDS:1 n=1 Tax=Acaulospora colombiana TaxID=27376 RepID=A0ACA9M2T7_9GLOM|nr:7922_t:CDS:2 [Acaulospora colombiana]
MKRERDDADDEGSSGDEMGPMPISDSQTIKKKRKGELPRSGAGGLFLTRRFPVLPHEKTFLEHLPSADQYFKSFMHRDIVNFVTVTRTEFLITTSIDGHLKLWKKQEVGIEFVKHYHAHLAPIVSVSASADGTTFASIADDGSCKVFDIENFGA